MVAMGYDSPPAAKAIDPTAYRLGLCLAGAATGGAYSAGVMDFLLEALASWQAEKDAGNDAVAQWNVVLSEVAGTSAGGITSTLALASFNIGHQPLPNDFKQGDPPPAHNPLFATWVTEMCRENLLNNSDIDSQKSGEQTVQSFLNADFIAKTAKKVLKDAGRPTVQLPKWAPETHLTLTATNLRGTPYSVPLHENTNVSTHFYMRRHLDYSEFLTTTEKRTNGTQGRARLLDMTSSRDTGNWKHAIACVRATAAYPLGFPSVQLELNENMYNGRLPRDPDFSGEVNIASTDSKTQVFAAVDGGMVDNEPFELVEKHMLERAGKKKLAAAGRNCWGSILIIDPFPENDVDNNVVDSGIPLQHLLNPLFDAVRGQACFKQSVLVDAADPDDMKKFLIAPKRAVKLEQKFALATGTLGNFGGIIDEKLRLHDFQLGRHNCQQFLEKVFSISKEDARQNPIFEGFSEDLFKDCESIPIIPLYGGAVERVPLPTWPSYSTDTGNQIADMLVADIRKRLEKVVYILGLSIAPPKWFFSSPTGWIYNKVMFIIRPALVERLGNTARKAVDAAMNCFSEEV